MLFLNKLDLYIYMVGAIALLYPFMVTITITVSVKRCFESAIAPILYKYIYKTVVCLSSYD